MCGPLLHQALALPYQAPLVILLHGRDVDGAQHLVLAAVERHQSPNHRLSVDAVGFRPLRPAIDEQARGIDHEDAVSSGREQTL